MKTVTSFLVAGLVALLGLAPRAQAQQGPCTPPTNISATGTGATGTSAASITVNFTPTSSANSYTVRYWWALDTLATNAQTQTVTAPPATLTGLQYSSYYYTVTSNCNSPGSATSTPQLVQLPMAPCNAPDTVQAVATGNTTATVSWSAVSGAVNYSVQVTLAGTTTPVANFMTTNNTAALTNLQPGTNYVVRIYTICSAGMSVPSAAASFRTTGSGTPPVTCDTVRGLSVSMITQTSARVSYTRTSGPVNYIINYRVQGSTGAGIDVTSNNPPLSLNALQPGTTYVVTIRANCSTGSVSPLSTTSFTTLAPAPPCGAVTNVAVVATSDSTALVSFTPGANNTSFYISYGTPGDSAQWLATNASPATIGGLVPGNTYQVQVTSVCGSAGSATYTPASPISVAFRGTSALATRAQLGAGVVAIYPNPAHRAVSVVLPAVPGAATAEVALLNAVGQQVYSRRTALGATSTRTVLDLTGVAPGLYVVRVVAGGQAASQRLAVE